MSEKCTCAHCGHRFTAKFEPKHAILCGDSTSAADVDRLLSVAGGGEWLSW